jgi:hypothetical protein
MATALLVVGAIGAVAGAVEQRKIGKAQRKQNRLTNKIAAITRRRGVKRQIAASRIQVAQQQAVGFQLGVSGGSAVQGASAGVLSDTASTIGASNLQATGQGFIAGFQNDISRAQGNQSIAGAVTSIAGGLSSNPQAIAGLEDLFGVGG